MLRHAVLYWACCIHYEHLSLSKQPSFSISVIMQKQANNILMPSLWEFIVYLDVSFIQSKFLYKVLLKNDRNATKCTDG